MRLLKLTDALDNTDIYINTDYIGYIYRRDESNYTVISDITKTYSNGVIRVKETPGEIIGMSKHILVCQKKSIQHKSRYRNEMGHEHVKGTNTK